jgi:hypothetical protein
LSNTNKNRELNVIQQIAIENNYHPTLIMQNKSKNNHHTQQTSGSHSNTINNGEENTKKWITFTYTGKETRYIIKLFKISSINQLFAQPTQSETIYFHNHKKKIDSVKQEYTNSNVKTARYNT